MVFAKLAGLDYDFDFRITGGNWISVIILQEHLVPSRVFPCCAYLLFVLWRWEGSQRRQIVIVKSQPAVHDRNLGRYSNVIFWMKKVNTGITSFHGIHMTLLPICKFFYFRCIQADLQISFTSMFWLLGVISEVINGMMKFPDKNREWTDSISEDRVRFRSGSILCQSNPTTINYLMLCPNFIRESTLLVGYHHLPLLVIGEQ